MAVHAEGSQNGAKVLALFIQLECVVLHADISLGEELVASASRQNVANSWHWIDLAFQMSIQGAKVADPSHSSVFLGNGEGARAPFTARGVFEDSYFD